MKFNYSIVSNYPAPLRLGVFIVLLLFLWLPTAIPSFFLFKYDLNLRTIITMGLLYINFIILLFFWNSKVHKVNNWWKLYGLIFTKKNVVELFNGLTVGIFFTFGLFIVEMILGWVVFIRPSQNLFLLVLEGLLSAFGIAFAEELFFRGWLLEELRINYSYRTILISNSLIFATLHFLKPLQEIIRTFPQFPALFLLGIILVEAKTKHNNRLGICIGIHGGLVWGYYILNVGKIIKYTDKASSIFTGIDNNPIAGIMGIIGLLALFFLMKYKKQY
ncbi:MAG: CPBP family intramembrane metalloprotease [Candidatus Atelocyanobacterium thalassa]